LKLADPPGVKVEAMYEGIFPEEVSTRLLMPLISKRHDMIFLQTHYEFLTNTVNSTSGISNVIKSDM
jgi:hypothetical protein